ncbi:MAG: efflux RND transporter periplasmic adaptor subunit [Acidobacteriota bacterium]|nr:efflux RND transporter periplasmic adaptor subunit [Blastocatellia bacterium]MDW8168707.1 efflux RND transporter periplasmic adaptor subunit [Acidobacteriota bacterium]MDW8256973.1 efflux RND transporter periplasmic adaptor subunit [Acidobacteriota bacterium]
MERMKALLTKKRIVILSLVLVVVVGGILSMTVFRQRAAASEFFTATVDRGPVRNVVNATGTVQAVVTVQVGSQVSGQIQALYADFNSVVKRGQLLAKIDPRNFEAQLENARANLAAAEARVRTVEAELNTQRANLAAAEANLEAARVAMENANLILRRYTELAQGGVLSQNDYDTAKANADSARARYNQALAAVQQVRAQIRATEAQLEQAKAQVEQARAEVNRAQVNLEYTNIYSPVDGVVISRNVDVGQTVAASLQAPTLFVIANDLTKMQVQANVDEADIGKISEAVDVRFTVDAYPNDTFVGRIQEIRLNPQTVQNVVTYSVIIAVDNPDLKLKPGMTANITITVDQRENVLRVSNAALRYLPPGITREKVMELLRQGPPLQPPSSPAGKPGAASSVERKAEPSARGGQAPEARPQSPRGSSQTSAEIPGLSPEAAALVRQLRDPNLTPEERQALVQKLRAFPEAERQKIRESFQRFRPEGETPTAASARPMERRRPTSAVTLAPGQLWDPAEKLRFPTPRETNRVRPAVVWVLNAQKKPEPRRVLLGITDGVNTEVLAGELKEGDQVIIGDTSQVPAQAQGGTPSPFGRPVGFGPPRPAGGGMRR